MKSLSPLLFFLLFSIQTWAQPSTACGQEGCATDLVNLSTGYDHTAGAPYPSGSFDAFWTLCESPDAGISVPRPAYVLTPNPAWDLVPNTAYISAYPNASLNADNPAPAAPYGFKSCFCVCEDNTEVTIDLSAHADNNVDIYLTDYTGTPIQSLLAITSTNTSAFQDPPEMSSTTVLLDAGDYCIRADLRNLSGVAMGMDIGCTLTGASLITSLCCQPNGSITGAKYHDLDCDGMRDQNEPNLPSWEIVLCDSTGLPITSVFTDAAGYYSFLDVPPGNYTVKENVQSGWTPSAPVTGQHQITVSQAQVVSGLDFGNCESESSCDILACQTDNIIINTGYDPVSGTAGPVGSYDAYWTVCETPDAGISVPRPAYLLSPNSAWANQANTAWISPYPNANLNANNPAPAPPYGIKYCFCVCDETDVSIALSGLADNNVDVNLVDKTTLSPISPLLSITATNTSAFNTPTTNTTGLVLAAGQYCIKADLRNLSGVAMGLNLQGTLSGGNLLSSICCDNTGSITGAKYNDLDCDGTWDSNEPGLSGWEINLCDATGNPITSATTDAAGFYTFTGLDPGAYQVKETQQEGWSQSQPAGGAVYTIGLSPKEIRANVDFGNCGFCPGNLITNGAFADGTPTAGDEDISNATGWAGIWSNGSSADFYNTSTFPPPFTTPTPPEQGNFAAFWNRLQGDQTVWREGIMTAISTPIPQGPGNVCYDLELKIACLWDGAFGASSLSIYGVNTTAPGTPTIMDGDTPGNLNIYPAGTTVELASYPIPASCNEDFQLLTFNFNTNILPPGGITHLFITRSDGASGGEYVAIDDVCLKPGECTPGECMAAWEYEVLECGAVHFINASVGAPPLTYCWDFDGDSVCDSSDENPTHVFPAPGNYQVCLKITDAAGCMDELCQNVSVTFDQGPPLISCPADVTIECDELPANIEPAVTNSPCAEELVVNCVRSDGLSLDSAYPACDVVTITCTATNEFGSAQCVFDVTTVDNAPPVANCIANLTVIMDPDSCFAFINVGDIDAGSADNCGIVSRSLDIEFIPSEMACQELQVALTVMDCGGNSDQCTAVVFAQDNTPPVIDCPGNIQVDCSDSLDPSNTGVPDATDNCPGEINATFVDTIEGSLPCDAVVIRTWTVTDACGNEATCTQSIFVADHAPPVIVCPMGLTANTDPGQCASSVALPSPDGTDNCSAELTFQCDWFDGQNFLPVQPNQLFPKGENLLRCFAIDECGNAGEYCEYTLTVVDNEPPVLTDCPPNITVNEPFGSNGANVTWGPPSANDNCEIISFECSHQPGDFFPCGNTEVTCSVVDCGGFVIECQFVVTVFCGNDPCDELDFGWSYDNAQTFGECCWLIDLGQGLDDQTVKSVVINNLVGADLNVADGNGWTVNQIGNSAEITFPSGGFIPSGNYADQLTVCFENITTLPQTLDLFWNIIDPSNPDSCLLVCPETIFSDCPLPPVCECGGFHDIVLSKSGNDLPLTCGGAAVDIGCPVNDFSISGNFTCDGDGMCDPTGLTWTLTRPDGPPLSGSLTGSAWSIGFATNDISQTGVYTLSLSGYCGENTCTCEVTWIQPECGCESDPDNIVQNGGFSNGQPTGGDEDIQNAAFWGPIWSQAGGESSADLYNAISPAPPGVFTTPTPNSQGNFAGFWNRLQGDQAVWREGIMNELRLTIQPNSGCYDLSLKVACLFEPPFGATTLNIYGVNNPSGAPGNITDGDTPNNLNIFPAGNTVELVSWAVPDSCDGDFEELNFQFDSSDPNFPTAGITHIFLTRGDGASGGEYIAVDDICLYPGECIPTVNPCDSLDIAWSYDNSQPDACCWNLSFDQFYSNAEVYAIAIDNVQGATLSVTPNGGWTVGNTFSPYDLLPPGGGPIAEGTYANQATICFENITVLPQSVDLHWVTITNNPDTVLYICPETIVADCSPPPMCTCGGFHDIVLSKSGTDLPLTCGGDAVDIGCPVNDFTVSGNFDCEGMCEPTNLTWELTRPDGSALSGSLNGGTWNIPFLTNDISQPGTYILTLSGRCDGDVCECVVTWIQPSCGCEIDPNCLTDVLDISTGIDQLSGASYMLARYDAFWSVVQTGANLAVPRPACVIPFSSTLTWGFQNDSEWISFIDQNSLAENNPSPEPPHAFERCFCLCSPEAEVTFDLSVMVDDIVDINLYGASNTPVTNLMTLDNTTSPNFGAPTVASLTAPLTEGEYCIRAEARNTDMVAFGFNLQGSISGGDFEKSECCRPGNIVYGVVYNDEDLDGFRDFGLSINPPEPGLNGWTVQLCDLGGTPQFTTMSDQYGYYEFVNVPPGNYLLKQIVMTNWTQTEPTTPEYNITLGAQDVEANLNFGNTFVNSTSSVADLGDIELYPNPAGEVVSLSFVQPSANALALRLTDLWGRTLNEIDLPKGETLHTLNIGHLPSAVYLLTLTDEDGRAWHGRFVKR